MQVRRARPQDAAAFARIVATVADEGAFILTEPPFDVDVFADRVRATIRGSRGDALWVLEDDGGRVVGNLGLHPVPRADGVFTLGMSLLADARGRGGGRALLEAALDWARDSGVHKVELEVFATNARAIALYASCGFVVEGVRRQQYLRRDGTRRDVLVMARLLDG